MNLADVMDEVATALEAIDNLRVFPYPPDRVEPPAAVVSWPDTYTYDETYGRGMDRLSLPVVVVVGRVSDRACREELGAYADGSGDRSVKEAVETGTYTACDTVRVESVEFDVVTIAGTDYMAALFTVDVAGSGG